MALNSQAAVAVAVVMAAAVLLMFAGEASAALTCGQVNSKLAPCVSYATGRGPLSSGCCNGIRGLNGLARTTPDRQAACKCLKSLAGSIKSIDMGKVSGAPGKCGVSVPFPISMSTDCAKYVYIYYSIVFKIHNFCRF